MRIPKIVLKHHPKRPRAPRSPRKVFRQSHGGPSMSPQDALALYDPSFRQSARARRIDLRGLHPVRQSRGVAAQEASEALGSRASVLSGVSPKFVSIFFISES